MGGFSASQAIIAAMITLALLILASGSLIATALLRLARVVDRVRKLGEMRASINLADELHRHRHRHRAELAERAVRLYFAAVLCFVLGGFGIAIDHFAADRLTWVPVGLTTIGMSLIVAGSVAMLAECRSAAAQIESEIRALGGAAADQP